MAEREGPPDAASDGDERVPPPSADGPVEASSGAVPLPPDGDQDSPLPLAHGYPAGLEDGERGQYPGPEQLGLMMLAIRDGITATATAHGLPRRTLTRWFEEYGTLTRVREWLHAETLGAYLRCEQDVYREVAHRLPSMPDGELGMTFRALINGRAQVPILPPGASANPPALAAAQVTVTVKGDGSEPEGIEVHT